MELTDIDCIPIFSLTDSSDIVDCKLKLILGLIWTLILHYSISMPMWDGDDVGKDGKGPTPKQRYFTSNVKPMKPNTSWYKQVDGMDPEQDTRHPDYQLHFRLERRSRCWRPRRRRCTGYLVVSINRPGWLNSCQFST